MTQQQIIQAFIENLEKSGLSEARKAYWLEKFESEEDFSDADEAAFEAELTAHMDALDADISYVEFETGALEEEKKRLLREALPDLREMAAAAGPAMDEEFEEYKKGVLAHEKAAHGEIEGLRTGGEAAEIAALRQKLGGNTGHDADNTGSTLGNS